MLDTFLIYPTNLNSNNIKLFLVSAKIIYISTYPKSETTLMQMILYHLTTDGRMNFKHIYEVSPLIHNASFLGQKPPDLKSPRIIKTHDNYKDFGKN